MIPFMARDVLYLGFCVVFTCWYRSWCLEWEPGSTVRDCVKVEADQWEWKFPNKYRDWSVYRHGERAGSYSQSPMIDWSWANQSMLRECVIGKIRYGEGWSLRGWWGWRINWAWKVNDGVTGGGYLVSPWGRDWVCWRLRCLGMLAICIRWTFFAGCLELHTSIAYY